MKDKLKDMEFPRYKYFVQVFVGEQRQQGMFVGHRLLWDNGTDSNASVTYENGSIFCVTSAYSVYQY